MQIPNCAAAALCLSAILAAWPAQAQTVHSIAGCQMLPANNIMNTPVDNLPVDPNSATYVSNIGASATLFPDFWSNASGVPINVVGGNQPRVPVTAWITGEADPGPFPIPADAGVQQASDAHLIVLDSSNCRLYEMWSASPNSDGSWTAGSAAVFDLKSNTPRPANWTSADAAGMPMLPGLVTYDEVMTGQITHALFMTVPYTQQQFIWPARHWASYYNGPQYPYMGQRFRLKAGFDVSSYPPEIQVILNALKKYGAIVEDNGAPWFLSGVQDPRWNNNDLLTLRQILGSNMEAVDESSLMVAANSQVAAGSPLALDGIYLDQRQVSAGAVVNAQATLTAPAPAGGATVSLSISSPGVLGVPGSVTIPAGAVSAPVPITVNNIGLTTPVSIIGSYQGVTVQSPILLVNGSTGVAAPRLSALTATFTTATITLTSAAAVDTVVALASSNSSVQAVPATVTVPAGTTTITVTLPAASAGTTVNLTATLYGESLSAPVAGLRFNPVAVCRVMDTRNANGPLGGPFIAGGTARMIPIPSSSCNIPANATAYSLNVTAVPRTGSLGYLTVWPTGLAQPGVSTLNSPGGLVLANAAIVPAGINGSINAYVTDDSDLVIDINGYFVPPASGTLQFYPMTPCRIIDTRYPTPVFGGPSIAGGTSRSFPIPSSTCKVPATAAAYSFNVTAVPQGPLGYLTAWPTGQPQPLASTLNSQDGTVLANAAIVPAGTNGAVSFYATNPTDLVVDINGYFAPPGTGGLNFYATMPCRIVDTRNANGTLGGPIMAGNTTRTFPLSQGTCGIPPSAAAYSLNMTVVPPGPLGYLTAWPPGQSQPLVSTLNALEGQIVANAALVPAGTGGVNVYVTNATHLIIDTNGYFQ